MLTFLMLACTGEDPSTPTTELLGETSESVSAADGATLSIEGVTLEIPPGALAEDTEITVRVYAPDDTLPEADALWGNVIVLEPHGLEFVEPVVLEIPAPDPLPLAFDTEWVRPGQGVAWLNEDAGAWELQPNVVVDGDAVALLAHFSTYAFASPGDPVTLAVDWAGDGGPSIEIAEQTCAAVGASLIEEHTISSTEGDVYWDFVPRKDPASDQFLYWACGRDEALTEQDAATLNQALLDLLEPPTACETLARSFQPIAPKQATLWEGDEACTDAPVTDADGYQALLDELAAAEDGLECASTVSAEADPCGLTRFCSDGADHHVALQALVNADDDYGGTLQIIDPSKGTDCTYSVSTEEPEDPGPTWDGDELDTADYLRWYADGFTAGFDFTLLTGYPGAGEGSLFAPEMYMASGELFNPGHTFSWDAGQRAFRFSFEGDANTGGFDMLCDYCEVGSELNDCADHTFEQFLVSGGGFEVGDAHPHPHPWDWQETIEGVALICDGDAAFNAPFDASLVFFR